MVVVTGGSLPGRVKGDGGSGGGGGGGGAGVIKGGGVKMEDPRSWDNSNVKKVEN